MRGIVSPGTATSRAAQDCELSVFHHMVVSVSAYPYQRQFFFFFQRRVPRTPVSLMPR